MSKVKSINFNELNRFIESCDSKSKIYIGCDSRVVTNPDNISYAFYTVAVVVHIANKHGGKIFYEKTIEKDYSVSKKKPSYRLMQEVYKASDMYTRLLKNCSLAMNREVEIHLDINDKKEHYSSSILNQAKSYIYGTCQIIPKIKPDSWAASTIADAL